MKKVLTLGIAAALLAVACAAYAYPSLAGPTGLIQAPTAPVVAPGLFNVAVDYVAAKQSVFVPATGTTVKFERDSYPIRALYGLAGCVEIGGIYDPDAVYGKGIWDVNAKYMLPYNCGGVMMAVGALYGTTGTVSDASLLSYLGATRSFTVKATEVYLVGTDNFCLGKIPVGVNLDVNWVQFEEIAKNSDWRVQFGADATLCKGLELVGDVQTTAKSDELGPLGDEKVLWSAGLRYAITPMLGAEAGVTNGLIVANTSKASFLVGLDYVFGLKE